MLLMISAGACTAGLFLSLRGNFLPEPARQFSAEACTTRLCPSLLLVISAGTCVAIFRRGPQRASTVNLL
jgi:hypothetical protein